MKTRIFNILNWIPPKLKVKDSTRITADGKTLVAETYSHSNPELTNGNNGIDHIYQQPTLAHVLAMAPRMLRLLIRLEECFDLDREDELNKEERAIAIEIDSILSELEQEGN